MFLGHKKIESYHEMVKRVPHNSIRALIPIKMTNFFNTKIPLNFWTQTYFDVGLLSLSLAYLYFTRACIAQLHGTNIHLGFVSLDLLNPNKF